MSDLNLKRKRNGGMEKVRDKKLKSLVEDEAKCRNLLDSFKVRPTPTKETVAEEQLPMNIQSQKSQFDVNSQHSIVSANLIPTSRLHLEAELTESNTVGYDGYQVLTETTLADQYPQNDF